MAGAELCAGPRGRRPSALARAEGRRSAQYGFAYAPRAHVGRKKHCCGERILSMSFTSALNIGKEASTAAQDGNQGERHGHQDGEADRRTVRGRSGARRCRRLRTQDGCVAARLPGRQRTGGHGRRSGRADRVLGHHAGRPDPGGAGAGGQEGRPGGSERSADPAVSGQGPGVGRARRQAAGGRDARAPARRRHDADGEVLHPQQRAASRRRPRSRMPGS